MHTILFVHASGLFQEAGETVARRSRTRVLYATAGGEALATARREKPDLIFVEAEMPGMTGVDVCRVLKADGVFSHTPLAVVCATREAEAESRRASADIVLERPLEMGAVVDVIRRHLQILPRDAARSSVGWDVTFWRDGVQHHGRIRDLSQGGFFVHTSVRQPIGARLEISFDVPGVKPGRQVVAEAIVVRLGQEPERGLGCRFFRLSAESRVHLEECLRILSLGEPATV
jgi:CheY-like chemotaxis protein